MILLAYIWITFIFLSVALILVAIVIEKNFDEEHPVKIWWRKHVVGHAPDDIDL